MYQNTLGCFAPRTPLSSQVEAAVQERIAEAEAAAQRRIHAAEAAAAAREAAAMERTPRARQPEGHDGRSGEDLGSAFGRGFGFVCV